MAMVSQLKNRLKSLIVLLIEGRTGGGDLPHGADHPGHRLIYIWDLRVRAFTM
jgi:hypothetical protein